MAVEFKLPEISEGVESVDIAEWLVKEGDTIEAGQDVCEVETDKAVAGVPCPHAGTVTKIHVAEGDSADVGSLLLTIDANGSAPAASSAPAAAPPASASKDAAPAPATPPAASPASAKPAATPASQPAASKPGGGSKISTAPKNNGKPPAPAGPATRQVARRLGVDLDLVKGTGKHGRISIEDVEGWVKTQLQSGSGGGATVASTGPLPDFEKFGPIERSKMNKIARTSAANLSAAWNAIPHVTQHDLADITDLESYRKRYVKSNPDKPKITMTAIMIKAVVSALKEFPTFNSSIDLESGEIILKDYFNIGVAVDTPNGLVVPVIRDCDQKSVLQVAADLNDVAKRARDRKLKVEEMQGGSFTITNLGGIGGTYFTPIVNWPEVAILGMSRGRKELQFGDEDDEIVERMMLPLSMSYDHRVVNGADAARFIVRLSGSLSNFIELF
ncbi:UNVERIFIED_CONTAM: hypothetical protein GTU68_033663 [Idotea baltica]|nr:hypothetical protein [Idotea baltica]